jgi:hypothetical protein
MRATRDLHARADTSSAAAARLEASEGSPELGFCGGDVAIGSRIRGDGSSGFRARKFRWVLSLTSCLILSILLAEQVFFIRTSFFGRI